LNRVVLRNDAQGTMYPINKVNFDDMILRGFKWQEARRPKSKQELFEAIKRKQEEDFDEGGTPVTTAPPTPPAAKPASSQAPAKPTAQPPAKPASPQSLKH